MRGPYVGDQLLAGRFLATPPFEAARKFAAQAKADLTVPNGPGIGDVMCFTRLVEDHARRLGRAIKLLTAPMAPYYGSHPRDGPYPIWENNPFVEDIIDANLIDYAIMRDVVVEKDNHFQFSHVIYNIGMSYGVAPTTLRPSLFLSMNEMRQALTTLRRVRRPVICLQASGKSSSPSGSPWHHDRWTELIERLVEYAGLIQLGRRDYEFVELPVLFTDTNVREALALIWASDIFIGFDSGLAHAAAAFSKPSIVLWDAVHKSIIEEQKEPGFALATLSRWAYPFNKNILILGEKNREALDAILKLVGDLLAHRSWPLLDG
jgi:Glycosyltransferase family 9 (heptosyltransferase)